MRLRIVLLAIIVLVLTVSGVAVALKNYSNVRKPSPENYSFGRVQGGSLCGGSCCASKGQGAESGVEAARRLAVDYYTSTYQEGDFTVEVKDFGCHQEASIIKDGKEVKRLSVSGGRVNEIS